MAKTTKTTTTNPRSRQRDAHVRARRRLLNRVIDRSYDRSLGSPLLDQRDREAKAIAGLALYCSEPWPEYFAALDQKSIPADIIHAIMCAGWMPDSYQNRTKAKAKRDARKAKHEAEAKERERKGIVIAQSDSVLVAKFGANSQPDPYFATFTEHATVCTCAGWHFRRTCKHTKALVMLAGELGIGS